jgi:transcription antitermination factor NusG
MKEAQVVSYCAGHLGVETYFPRLRQYRTIRRQRKSVTGPLFPRYLFCRFDAPVFYRAVRYAPDVLKVVSAGDAPAIVADSLIENLKQWASEENDLFTLRPTLRIGDAVEVISGPMQGLSGVILGSCDERERVTLLLSFLQCGAQLTVDRSEIRLIA